MELLELNNDCLRRIASYLDAKSFCRFSRVSKRTKHFADNNYLARPFRKAHFDVVITADVEGGRYQLTAQNDVTDVVLEETSLDWESFSLAGLLSRTTYAIYDSAVVTLVAKYMDIDVALMCIDQAQMTHAEQFSFSWEDPPENMDAVDSSMNREAVIHFVGFDFEESKQMLKLYMDISGPVDAGTDLEEHTEMQYDLVCMAISDENKSLEAVNLWNSTQNILSIIRRFCRDLNAHTGTIADFRFSFIVIDGAALKDSFQSFTFELQQGGDLSHAAQYDNSFLVVPKNQSRLIIALEEISADQLNVSIQNLRNSYGPEQ